MKRAAKIWTWRPGNYLRSSGILLLWLALRAISQCLLVILMVNWLDANTYGVYVSLTAMASFFVPFAGLGLHAVLLCNLPKQQDQGSRLISEALALWRIWIVPVGLAAGLFAYHTLPTNISAAIITLFCMSEIVSSSIIEITSRIEQAKKMSV